MILRIIHLTLIVELQLQQLKKMTIPLQIGDFWIFMFFSFPPPTTTLIFSKNIRKNKINFFYKISNFLKISIKKTKKI